MLVSPSGKPFTEDATIPTEPQIRHDIAYINSMLTKLGMECPLAILHLPDEQNSNGKLEDWSVSRRWELGQACSVMIPLLTAKVREQAFRAEVEDRVRRLAEDLQDRSTQLNKQQIKAGDLERQVQSLREELKLSHGRCKELEGNLTRSKEESTRLRAAFQLKEKHFIHELRKKEHEFDRLKEQLQGHFNREILAGAAVDRAELARLSMAPEATNRMSIYGEPVEEIEGVENDAEIIDRLTGLETENESMRTLLLTITQLLSELKHILEIDEAESEHGRVAEAAMNGMPIDWVYEEIKEDIERSLALLSKRVAHICGINL